MIGKQRKGHTTFRTGKRLDYRPWFAGAHNRKIMYRCRNVDRSDIRRALLAIGTGGRRQVKLGETVWEQKSVSCMSAIRRSALSGVRSLNSVITDIIDTFNTNKIYIMYTINRFGGNGNGKLGRARWVRWRMGTKAAAEVQFTHSETAACILQTRGRKDTWTRDMVESLKRSEERPTSTWLCTTFGRTTMHSDRRRSVGVKSV